MVRTRLIALLGVVALAAGGASAGFTTALDPVQAAVAARSAATDTSARAGRRDRRALERAAAQLGLVSSSVADDLRIAKKTSRALDSRFRDDPTFGPLLDAAIDALETDAVQLRDGLAAWEREFATPKDAHRLATAVQRFDRLRAKAEAAAGNHAKRSAKLRKACGEVERAAVRAGVDAAAPPVAGRVQNFLLTDVNATSPTDGTAVSPRDFVGKVSAWYFGHST